MAALARLTSSLYSIYVDLLRFHVSLYCPAPSKKLGFKPSKTCPLSLNVFASDTRPVRSLANGHGGNSNGFRSSGRKVDGGRKSECARYPSHSGSCAKLGFRVSSTARVAVQQSCEVSVCSTADVGNVGHDRSALTPLCERPASCVVSLVDVCRWRFEAQKLADSVGSQFFDADGGPEVSNLLTELEWLLDDAVAACGFSSEVHSDAWKPCAWRDVKYEQTSKLGSDELLVPSFSSIPPSWPFGDKDRHTDPVIEFAADFGFSCDGIRESLVDMASNVHHTADSEGRMTSIEMLLSGSKKPEDESDVSSDPGALRTSSVHLLLRISMEELDKLWKERIQKRRPFQYIVAAAHWRDFILGVVEGVLIPRPETEQIVDLVEVAISRDKSLGEGVWADLGTGSGAIAIALARILQPSGSVIAIDASSAAVSVARRNVERYLLETKVQVRQGFWFSPWLCKSGELAGVISNPPYIPSGSLATLQEEVRQHEPRIALDGGPDGMTDLREICWGSARALRSEGFLALETNGGEQAEVLCDLLSTMRILGNSGISHLCFRDVKSVKDFAGISRFVTATRC